MDTEKVIARLKHEYPGKKIIITDPKNPTEIICEIEPTKDHPKWSGAIAVIEKTRLHYHRKLTETYHVLKGSLTIYLNNKPHFLRQGDFIEIKPKTIHWSQGKNVWVFVYSRPGWTPKDHILVFPDRKVSRKQYDRKFKSAMKPSKTRP